MGNICTENHQGQPSLVLCSPPGTCQPQPTPAVLKWSRKQLGLIPTHHAYFLALQRRNHKSRILPNINSEGWNIPRNKQTKLLRRFSVRAETNPVRQMHCFVIASFVILTAIKVPENNTWPNVQWAKMTNICHVRKRSQALLCRIN